MSQLQFTPPYKAMPLESGPYIVCVEKQTFYNKPQFLYVAYYNSETGRFLKFDPFNSFLDPEAGEFIEEKIIGWFKEPVWGGLASID